MLPTLLIVAAWLVVGILVARKVFAISDRVGTPLIPAGKEHLFLIAMLIWPVFLSAEIVEAYRAKIKH